MSTSDMELPPASPDNVVSDNQSNRLSAPDLDTNKTSNNANSRQEVAVSFCESDTLQVRTTSPLTDSSLAPSPSPPVTVIEGSATTDEEKSPSSRLIAGVEDGVETSEPVKTGRLRRLMNKTEVPLCGIGLVTFALGLVLIVVSLIVMDTECGQKPEDDLSSSADAKHAHKPGHGYHDYYDYTQDDVFPDVNITDDQQTTNSSRPHDATSNAQQNLALGRRCSQSSTMHSNGTYYNASLAVDGNDQPRLALGTCSQTEWQERPWWRVDVESVRRVQRIHITIPKDCCGAMMHNFEVRVARDDTDATFGALCRYHMGATFMDQLELRCQKPLFGRYVYIVMLGNRVRPINRLTLCEVKVFNQ